MLAVIETHPIQYHAPVYRALQTSHGVPVTAIYASDFSVAGYRDREFGATFRWDTDLLSGYGAEFLSRVAEGGAPDADAATTDGLRAALRRIAPDAVLVTGYSPAFHRSAWFEAWRTGRPVLFRGEASDLARSRTWLRDRVRRFGLGIAYRSCARVLYIGAQARSHYEALGVPAERLVFSPYCVDVTPFVVGEDARTRLRASTRATLGIDDDRLVWLYSGKLSARKGVDLIVRAVRELPEPLRARVTLLFLGDGGERDALAALAAAAPSVPALFVGFKNQRELSAYYHAADLLLLPSRHSETWGLVVNEALHHGVPCVVSDQVGCAADLVVAGVTGAVARADSVSDLARAAASVCGLAGRPATRDACRRHVASYSVDTAAAGIADAYRSITGPNRVARSA